MKVTFLLSLVATVALASLEPAGYRPPGSSSPPSSRYLPSNRFTAPSSRYLPASQSPYSASAPIARPSNVYLPANEYESADPMSEVASPYSDAAGPSAFPESKPSPAGYSTPIGAPSQRYLPASNRYSSDNSRTGHSGYGYGADGDTEPAKYEFNYEVKDDYGNDFGHQESRDGDETRGIYTVLLPDGRKQIVEYEANQDGFKPKISYEEPKQNGYDAGRRQGSQSGYPQGPY